MGGENIANQLKRKITDEEIRATMAAAAPMNGSTKKPEHLTEFKKSMDMGDKTLGPKLSTLQFTEDRTPRMTFRQNEELPNARVRKKEEK